MKRERETLYISFVGPSGSGKSTCYSFAAPLLENLGYGVFRCDVARPLRLIQCYAYDLFGLPNPGNPDEPAYFKQDGQFLSFLAKHFENRLGSYIEKFIADLKKKTEHSRIAFINTDCRNNAYATLRNLGFIFIHLNVAEDLLKQRRQARNDITSFNYQAAVEQFDLIEPSFTISNNGTMKELEKSVQEIIRQIISL